MLSEPGAYYLQRAYNNGRQLSMRTVRRPWQTLGSRRHDVSIFLSWASRREKRGDWARCNTKTCQRPSLTPVICVVFSPYAHIMTAGVLAMGGCTAGVRRPTPPNAAGGLDLAGRPRSLASRAQTRSVPKCDLALAASVSGCRKGRSLPKLVSSHKGSTTHGVPSGIYLSGRLDPTGSN